MCIHSFKKKEKPQTREDAEYDDRRHIFSAEEDDRLAAEARLSQLGRDEIPIEKTRKCVELFKFRPSIWRAYMRQDRHGEKWMATIMLFQIFYIALYVAIDTQFVNANDLNSYDIFNAAILMWLAFFCLFFLYNSIRRFAIAELKIGIVCFGVMSVYTTLRYCMSCTNIYNVHRGHVFDHR